MRGLNVRRSIVSSLVVLGMATSAAAQDVRRMEVSGGWQLLWDEDDTNFTGWHGEIAANLNPVVALVGQVDGVSDTFEASGPSGNLLVLISAETRLHTFLGGGRLNLRTIPRIVPFGELLFGVIHLSNTARTDIPGIEGFEPIIEEASQTEPALQIGGGVTLGLSDRLGVRVAVGRRRIFVDGESGALTRVAVGLALRF